MEPAIGPDRFGRTRRVVVVALHHKRAAIHQFAALATRHFLVGVIDIDDTECVARIREANGSGLVRALDRVRAHGTYQFRHALYFMGRAARARGELQRRCRRQCLPTHPAARQTGEIVFVEVVGSWLALVRYSGFAFILTPPIGPYSPHPLRRL